MNSKRSQTQQLGGPLVKAAVLMYLAFETGMEKINFSGGEPFLHDKGDFLGELVRFCKQDLRLPSVSIVSNGSMIKERWFQKYGKMLHNFFAGQNRGKIFYLVQAKPNFLHQVTIWTSWRSPATVSVKTPTS